MSTRNSIGRWILPQPKDVEDHGKYIQIPRLSKKYVPFGYKICEEDENVLDPIPHELKALEKAKKYLKQYPSREVAAWLTKVTGRSISHAGLLKRLKHEQYYKTRIATLRKWVAKYKKAVEEIEKYEKRLKGVRESVTGSDADGE